MAPAEPRPALGARKQRRPHPASPVEGGTAVVSLDIPARRAGNAGERPVMLCVRVAESLRKRVKLAALESGRPVQELVGEALERECRRVGV
jgi:hypothetical protein